ncbi:MAG: twin-arginine translocation signal domain-containing protein [Deltaproteobacteria bacterium]|nr:twin-arginine translocation signal domain-containing protein [Deltaproteobacteria bacterium]
MSDKSNGKKMGMTRRNFLQASALGAAMMVAPEIVWAGGRKILRTREYMGITSFDPAIMSGIPEETANAAIYNKLISFKPGEQWAWQLEIAESIEQVDPTHIKFKLKPGVKFTDGFGEMTTEDVKFSFERHLDPKLKSQLKGDLGPFTNVDIVDKYSGVIVLKEPFQPFWMVALPYMACNIISKKATEKAGGTFTTPPCSSGPYKFKEWKQKERTVLVRNPDWNGPPADFDEIHMLVMDDEKTAEIAFEAGDVDYTRISLESLGNFLSKPPANSTVLTRPSTYYVWLGMNTENEVLKDIKIRKAVQSALDVGAILKAAYFDAAKRATGMVAPGLLGHREKNLTPDKPDVEKAKKLLAEAGHAKGLKLTLDVLNKSTWVTAAQVIQASLAAAGIELQINMHDSGTFWSLGDQSKGDSWKKVQLILNRFSTAPDPYYTLQWFTKEQVGIWNWERWVNPEYDSLHQKAAVELDIAKRGQMYQRMQDLMEESGAYTFITNEVVPVIFRNDIKPALRPDGLPLLRYFKSA